MYENSDKKVINLAESDSPTERYCSGLSRVPVLPY
uniref:Uncharacterized protein n=1 Tax=Anguilla anguilla TaxID=7936 RepID=A0A0E9UQ66_ANGAN